MEKIISTNNKGYNQIRNFIDLPHGYTFIAERDIFTTLLNQYFRQTKKTHHFFQFLHYHPGFSKVKSRHFFNTISFNNTPFIVTFETTLPRLGNAPKWFYDIAAKRLASKYCKKIIAISQNAYNLQLEYLEENYPQHLEVIKNKMMVLPPPQIFLIKDYSEKQLPENKIVFTLVGADFFRKGGREILNVFDKLIPRYPEILLNIVSEMNYGDYASKTTKKDFNKAWDIIKKHPINIKHFHRLQNDEVLELYKQTHIGLLPTWGETFGYSVLEAQAAGCPVISTNLRALPEINNNEIGWVIEVPIMKNKNGINSNKKERIIFQNSIEKGLENNILEILNNKSIIMIKAVKALKNISFMHNPLKNADILKQIYDQGFKL